MTGRTDDTRHDATESVPRLGLGPSGDLDVTYRLLTERRRRYLLYHLHDLPTGSATVEELAAVVAAWEELTREPVPDDHAAGVERSLVTDHLPVLDAAGLVDYDARSGAVKYHGENETLGELLELGTIDELP